jgi:exosortase
MGMICALALLVALVYSPSAAVLGEEWGDFRNLTYTHGWLVLGVCIALLIRARHEIADAPARAWPLAQLALAVCIFAWLVCYRASIQDLHVTIFPAIFWLAASAAFGWAVARLLFFPVAFFYFAVPSWSQLNDLLQDLTVVAMRAVLAFTGPPAVISGDIIHIPNGSFEIQEGCSGLHFMLVGLAVAALHGELRRDRLRTRLGQLLLMVALALLANWVRVYVVIEAGYLSNMHSNLLRNHYWFGWGVFAVMLGAFFWITAHFEPAALGAAAVGARERQSGVRGPRGAEVAGFGIAAVLLVALPAASAAVRSLRPPAPLAASPADPRPPWVPAPLDLHSSWQPVFNDALQQRRLAFTNTSGETVEVFSVSYRTQRQGAKLVGLGSSIVGRGLQERWQQVVSAAHGEFREIIAFDRSGALYLIWVRYQSAGRDFATPLLSQLWYGVNATVSNPSASLVAFRTPCRPDCPHARRVLWEITAGATAH